MGKALILENKGAGKYLTRILRSTELLSYEILRNNASINELNEIDRNALNQTISDEETNIASARANINADVVELNDLIQNGTPPAHVDELLAAVNTVNVSITINQAVLQNQKDTLQEIERQLSEDTLTPTERSNLESDKRDLAQSILVTIQILNDLRAQKKELQGQVNGNPVITAELKRITEQSKQHQTDFVRALSNRDLAAAQLASLELRIAQLFERNFELQRIIDGDVETELWCTDLTTNLAGPVATLEVPGEPRELIIVPGFGNNAAWFAITHGIEVPAQAFTPSGFFYNLAMTPGWQVYKPRYRLGKIVEIKDGEATVTFNEKFNVSNYPLERSVPIDLTPRSLLDNKLFFQLTKVPFEYMTCNSGAFALGDEVVVQFAEHTPTSAKIIGFRKNPKACGSSFFAIDTGLIKPAWSFTAKSMQGVFSVENLFFGRQGYAEYYGFDDNTYGGMTWAIFYEIDGPFSSPNGTVTNRLYSGGDLLKTWTVSVDPSLIERQRQIIGAGKTSDGKVRVVFVSYTYDIDGVGTVTFDLEERGPDISDPFVQTFTQDFPVSFAWFGPISNGPGAVVLNFVGYQFQFGTVFRFNKDATRGVCVVPPFDRRVNFDDPEFVSEVIRWRLSDGFTNIRGDYPQNSGYANPQGVHFAQYDNTDTIQTVMISYDSLAAGGTGEQTLTVTRDNKVYLKVTEKIPLWIDLRQTRNIVFYGNQVDGFLYVDDGDNLAQYLSDGTGGGGGGDNTYPSIVVNQNGQWIVNVYTLHTVSPTTDLPTLVGGSVDYKIITLQ